MNIRHNLCQRTERRALQLYLSPQPCPGQSLRNSKTLFSVFVSSRFCPVPAYALMLEPICFWTVYFMTHAKSFLYPTSLSILLIMSHYTECKSWVTRSLVRAKESLPVTAWFIMPAPPGVQLLAAPQTQLISRRAHNSVAGPRLPA